MESRIESSYHVPVLYKEVISGLNLRKNCLIVDGTLGGGGHSYEILKRSSPNGKLIATDLDDYALSRAKDRLLEFDGRFELIKSNFKNFPSIKEELCPDGFDGILLDLGVSSFQLDDRERGFSYMAKKAGVSPCLFYKSPYFAAVSTACSENVAM